MIEALGLPFFQRVLLAGLLASIACGVVGTFVVAKRITSLAGGVAHAAFAGVGLGYLLGFSPMLGAAGVAVVVGLAVGLVHRRRRSGLDTLIAMAWAIGMALGIVFVSLSPGPTPDLMSYLFGSLLFVSWEYVVAVAALDAAIVLTTLLLFKEFQAVCFDEEFTEVTGAPVRAVLLGLLAMISLAVVMLIRVVGVILVIALLAIPASIGRHWAASLGRTMWLATGAAAVCTAAGLLLSFELSQGFDLPIPAGPLIVLLAAAAYGVSAILVGSRTARR